MKIKAAAVTGSRADYGLLYPLLKKIAADSCFNLDILATGMHLDEKYGNTKSCIINDGFSIAAQIDLHQQGDRPEDICNAISKGLEGFSGHFSKSSYDLIIVLGDRYELWPVCMAAVMHRIPIAHIHGGETTEGALDEQVRHSVTKMSTVHFTAAEEYRHRVIQMGEDPQRVFNVGGLGIDNIKNMDKMPINELSDFLKMEIKQEKLALMTFHPITTAGYNEAGRQVCEMLDALSGTDLQVVVTMPNSDIGSNGVLETIIDYSARMPEKFIFRKHLGQRAYISAMSYARLMVGNSSSGIIEAVSFGLPVVNIGDRQAGRIRTGNIIDCRCKSEEISAAVSKAMAKDFTDHAANIVSPYGDGHAADRIVEILKSINFEDKAGLLKKEFHNLMF